MLNRIPHRSLLLILGIVLTTSAVNAQHQIGLVGGFNIATLAIQDVEDDITSHTTFTLGAVLDLDLGRNLTLRLEPTYLQKGANQKTLSDGLGDLTVSYEFASLELPVLLTYQLASGSARPYLFAGPSLGIRLDSKLKANAALATLEADLVDVIKPLDVSLNVGAGVRFPVGRVALFVEGHYTHGLRTINNGGTVPITGGGIVETIELDTADVTTRGVQVMAGFTIPLGR